MSEPLALDLPGEVRRLLTFMGDVGILGSSPEEVAAYLVTRGIDDMFRAGTLKLESVPASDGAAG